MNKSFKFSIVIAVYNMENYLVDAIQSILNQTIGFEDNLQVLFVNDGSVDNSEAICLSYVQKYPDNIQYIYKENGGVSSARNKGMECATGELVNFLDADDMLALDALEKVYDFYTKHKDEVDLISIPLHFFEGEEGEHLLNFKFERTRVIDIFKEPKCFQMHISSSFIKLAAIKKYSFETKLKFGEDAQVANKVILDKGKYGVIADTKYMYRKRVAGNSVIQGARANKANYLPPLKYLHLELIQFALEKYGQVPEYLQRMLTYDLGWKIRVPYIDSTVLSQSEIEEIISLVKQITSYIEDEIILAGFNTRRCFNLYLLTLKHQELPNEKLTLISNKEDAVLCYQDSIVDMLYKQVVCIENIEIGDNSMRLLGSFSTMFVPDQFKLFVDINGKETSVLYQKSEKYQVTSLNQFVMDGYEFYIDIPLGKAETNLKVKVKLGDTKTQIKFELKQDENIADDMNADSILAGGYRISTKNKAILIKKIDQESNKEKNVNNSENVQPRQSISNSIKMHLKNRTLLGCIRIIFGILDKKSVNKIMKKLDDKKLLCKIVNKIPAHYRYYVLSRLKNKEESESSVVSTYHQACIYHSEQLLSKLTDVKVNINKFKIENDNLSISSTVISPFNADLYQLKCFCNGQYLVCEPKLNKKKSLNLRKESLLGCYEYEVKLPIKEESKIYFELTMKEANVISQFNLNEDNFIQVARKAGYLANIVDKKMIMLNIE